MTVNFIWDDAYLIGVKEVDLQHQGLFAIANMLETVSSEDHLKNILMRLYKYTREHFSAEELLMREASYPEFKSHVILHDALLESLIDNSGLSFADPQSMFDLKQFIFKWLTHHIQFHDVKFATYLKNRNV